MRKIIAAIAIRAGIGLAFFAIGLYFVAGVLITFAEECCA